MSDTPVAVDRSVANYQRAKSRRAFIEEIMRQVATNGKCSVSLLSTVFDDPPRHPIAEFALQVHERETRGRDLEPPLTLIGELRRVCAATGFEIIVDGGLAHIKAPPRECEVCNGGGRIQRLRGSEAGAWADPAAVIAEMLVISEICGNCGGTGKLAVKLCR